MLLDVNNYAKVLSHLSNLYQRQYRNQLPNISINIKKDVVFFCELILRKINSLNLMILSYYISMLIIKKFEISNYFIKFFCLIVFISFFTGLLIKGFKKLNLFFSLFSKNFNAIRFLTKLMVLAIMFFIAPLIAGLISAGIVIVILWKVYLKFNLLKACKKEEREVQLGLSSLYSNNNGDFSNIPDLESNKFFYWNPMDIKRLIDDFIEDRIKIEGLYSYFFTLEVDTDIKILFKNFEDKKISLNLRENKGYEFFFHLDNQSSKIVILFFSIEKIPMNYYVKLYKIFKDKVLMDIYEIRKMKNFRYIVDLEYILLKDYDRYSKLNENIVGFMKLLRENNLREKLVKNEIKKEKIRKKI